MKKTAFCFLLIATSVGVSCLFAENPNAESFRTTTEKSENPGTYDGRWWLAADNDLRAGFLDGLDDCLIWVAHERWTSHSPAELDKKITDYYTTHPQDIHMNVSDVWRKLAAQTAPEKPQPGTEVWANPHGYYDGLWWRQGSESENRGFLEGYLWCLRAPANHTSESYSRSVAYYADKISEYVTAQPKADHEPVAVILHRFRDQPNTK